MMVKPGEEGCGQVCGKADVWSACLAACTALHCLPRATTRNIRPGRSCLVAAWYLA